MTQLDWSRFNWSEIFGTIYAIKPLLSKKQSRMMAVDIQENVTAKYSAGQLKYVGNTEIGKDFIGCDGLRYESKSIKGLIKKKGSTTKAITLKNYHGKCLGVPDQTFDYMIAFDSTKNTVLLADWDHCINPNTYKIIDSKFNIYLELSRCEVIAKDVYPVDRSSNDMLQKYHDFVFNCIGELKDEKEFVMMDDPLAIIKRVPLEGTLEEFLKPAERIVHSILSNEI